MPMASVSWDHRAGVDVVCVCVRGVGGWRRLVGPMSLRHRARPLSTLTRGPYSVRPWSAAEERSLFLKLPDGHRTHHPPPQRHIKMMPSGVALSKVSRCFGAAEVGGVSLT